MTTITIYKSDQGSYNGFTGKGHAGVDDSGNDIVCAAISMLVTNTINSIEELLHEEVQVKDDEITGYIDCRFPNEISEHAKLLIDSMILGLESIVSQCGKKYLRLKFEEV